MLMDNGCWWFARYFWERGACDHLLSHSIGGEQFHLLVEPHNTISCVLFLLQHTNGIVVVDNVQ